MNVLRRLLNFVADYELVMVAAVVALATAEERFLPLALGVIVCLTLLRWAARGRLTPPTPQDFAILGVLGMAGVSLVITPVPQQSRLQALRLACGVGLFYSLVGWVTTRKRAETLMIGAGLLAGLLALVSLVSVEWVTDKLRYVDFGFLQRLPELVSDRVHPNVMAGNLAILFPFPAALALFWRGRAEWVVRVCSTLCAGLVAGVIVLTESRGALLAMLAAAYLLVWLRSAWMGGGLTVIGLAALGDMALRGYDFQHTFYWLVMAGGDTLGLRVQIWQRALMMLTDFPFTGVGLGGFTAALNNLYPLRATPVEDYHAHQLFLQVAVDLGLPGLAAWCAGLLAEVACALELFWARRGQGEALLRLVGAASLASLTALVADGLIDAVTWGTRAEELTWGIWGLCAGVWVYALRSRRAA